MHAVHEQTKLLAGKIRGLENSLVELIIQIDSKKLYRELLQPSLFAYCVNELDLSESRAYELITVSRKALDTLELREALQGQSLSISKAAKICSSITNANAKELVDFASKNTARKTQEKLQREGLTPKLRKLNVQESNFAVFERTAEVMGLSIEQALLKLCEEKLKKSDKLARAERVAKKKNTLDKEVVPKTTVTLDSQPAPTLDNKRRPIPAAVKNDLLLKFGGQCCIKDKNGIRCANKRFLHQHHINEVQNGGTNDIENLVLVCSEHHEMIHQTDFLNDVVKEWKEIIEKSLQ